MKHDNCSRCGHSKTTHHAYVTLRPPPPGDKRVHDVPTLVHGACLAAYCDCIRWEQWEAEAAE